MAQIRSSSAELIAFFETGDIPTADNFSDFILSTALYDGSLSLISGSASSTGSFGTVRSGRIIPLSGSNSVTFSASLVPDNTHQQNIGSVSKKVKNTFINTASIDVVSSSLTPRVTNTLNLGSSTRQWRDLHIDGTAFIDTIDNESGTPGVNIVTASFTHGISSSILPDVDNLYDLGSSGREWKDLHIDGTANIDFASIDSASIGFISSSLVPYANNTYSLGTPSLNFKGLHVSGTAFIETLSLPSLQNNVIIPNISKSMGITGSISPGVDDTFDLGGASKEWKDLYIDGVARIDALGAAAHDTSIAYIQELSGSSASPTITASVNIIPKEDNLYDLGSSTKEWKDLYVDGTAYIDNIEGVSNITSTSASVSYLSGSSPITVGAAIIPDLDNIHSLGSETNKFKNLFISGAARIESLEVVRGVSSSLVPYQSNEYDLGTSLLQWRNLHIDGTANIDNADLGQVSIGLVTSNIIPSTNSTLVLGSPTKSWKALYVTNITASNISASGVVKATSFLLNGTPVGTSTDTYWSTGSGESIFYNGGNVGLGDATPTKRLVVSGSTQFNGFAAGMGFGNATTISHNTTVPEGFNSMLFTSNYNNSITVQAGVDYTISTGADVRLVNMSNIGNIPQSFYNA